MRIHGALWNQNQLTAWSYLSSPEIGMHADEL